MKKYLLLFALAVYSLTSFAQEELLDSVSLAVYQEYTDLDEALKNPDNVVKLTLRKKKYKVFPRELFKFKNLQYLDLGKNALKELPDSIVQFKKLQYLIVSKNELERLPVNIGKLKTLKYLNINQNNLVNLPYSIGELEDLEYADMWSNNLEYFPESLKGLKSLKVLDLRNILISKEKQDQLQAVLPKTKIYFSPPCNCGS